MPQRKFLLSCIITLVAILLIAPPVAFAESVSSDSKVQAQSQAQAQATTFVIQMEYSQVPEMKAWAGRVEKDANMFYPKAAEYLRADGFTPPRDVRITIVKDKKGIADTRGAWIQLAPEWFLKKPEDIGAVMHELAHVAQQYRGSPQPPYSKPSWLVEGIADYVRFWMYEPKGKRPRVNPDKAQYNQGYQTTGAFLAWLVEKKDEGIVKKLNDALRRNRYREELFKDYTGKTLDELWKEFTDSLKQK
ncbi:MAG: basic secretory protein-like protein [Candidatus Sumerlaeota bacterium]|nr:basic secretory protein-like protein [Candidatus Sumerlaeota bacterium]